MHLARASLFLSLWVHILIPGTMPDIADIAAINPWLSACDLMVSTESAPSDCPHAEPPPPNSKEEDTCQCLYYFTRSDFSTACTQTANWRESIFKKQRLTHCREFHVYDVLSDELMVEMAAGEDKCLNVLDQLINVDDLAARVSSEFSQVLRRFDCDHPYTVKFNCTHCQEAYRRWVCTSLFPYYANTTNRPRVRPCRTLCQAVEQQCPYFLPADHAPGYPTQYAGEPTFLCRDPNIPETGEQLERSLYPSDHSSCVTHCIHKPCAMCVRGGNKIENLTSYSAALNESGECVPIDFTAPTRGTGPICVAAPMYSSPHHLPSCAPSTGPTVLLLPILAVLLTPLSLPLTLTCLLLYLRSAFLADIVIFLYLTPRLRRCLGVFCSAVSPHKVTTNHFHSKKWQYYFILISVNLVQSFTQFFLTPSKTPRGSCKDSAGTRKTRLKLINYFFSNLPISSFAQYGVVRGQLVLKPTPLLEVGRCYKDSSRSDTRLIRVYQITLKDLKISSNTKSLEFPTSCQRQYEITIRVFKHSSRYKYVWYSIKKIINETYIKKYSKQRLIKLKKTNRCIVVGRRHKTNLEYVGLCVLERERFVKCLRNR